MKHRGSDPADTRAPARVALGTRRSVGARAGPSAAGRGPGLLPRPFLLPTAPRARRPPRELRRGRRAPVPGAPASAADLEDAGSRPRAGRAAAGKCRVRGARGGLGAGGPPGTLSAPWRRRAKGCVLIPPGPRGCGSGAWGVGVMLEGPLHRLLPTSILGGRGGSSCRRAPRRPPSRSASSQTAWKGRERVEKGPGGRKWRILDFGDPRKPSSTRTFDYEGRVPLCLKCSSIVGGERGTKSGRRSAQELGKADGGSCYWGTAAVGNQTGSTSPKPGLGGEFLAVESLPGV